MAGFDRITVRSPRPFDVVGDSFILCGLGRAIEGVIGSAVLTEKNGTVLDEVSPMFVPKGGFLFTLFDFPVAVGAPATPGGVLTVEPITQAGCRRAGIAQDGCGDANLWPRALRRQTGHRHRPGPDPDWPGAAGSDRGAVVAAELGSAGCFSSVS